MSSYAVAYASVLVVFGGSTIAQDRVVSYWLGPQGGSFTDEINWSDGVPSNSATTVYDAVIAAEGGPHTVFLEFGRFSSELGVQSLTLDSSDATLELNEQYSSGGLYVEESFSFPAGTLVLRNSALKGEHPNTRMDIGPESSFEFATNGSSQHVNSLRNFSIYGGDVDVLNSADLNITGTHIREGALVLRSFGAVGRNLITESIIDFDIRFENTTDRRYELMTHVDGLEIAEGVTISGRDFWLTPVFSGFPNFDPASFINRGLIRLDGGEARITHTENHGEVEVAGGTLTWNGDNEGEIRATSGAELITPVSNNGGDLRFHNSGLIEVSGEGARFEITGGFITDADNDHSYWSNTGTLRVTDHARARLGSLAIHDLGHFERDSTTRVEITGQIDLGGSVVDANTFDGDAWLTYNNPGGSGGIRGEIRNGRIDLSGGWLRFSQDFGYLSNVEIIHGPLVVSGDASSTTNPFVMLDNVEIPNGGVVLERYGHIGFGTQVYDSDLFYYNSSISTTHTGGPQSVVRYDGRDLHLGQSAHVSGNLDFGVASYTYQKIINEGVIVTTMLSGRLDILSPLENYGVVESTQSSRMTFRHLDNFGSLLLTNATVSGWSVQNSSFINLAGTAQLNLSGVFELQEGSELTIESLRGDASVVAPGGVQFDGTLNLDLSSIDSEGTYLLFQSQSFEGNFDMINVSGLDDELDFDGFDSSTGSYVISRRCLLDLNGDGQIDLFDVSFFLSAYSDGDPVADYNKDGVLNFFDVSAYIVAYIAGCP